VFVAFPRSTRYGTTALSILAVGLLALVGPAGDADARNGRPKRAAERVPPTPEKEQAKQQGPILAVISLGRQRISVYGSGGLIATSAVSTGRSGYPTPTGVFSIIQKNRHHRSNIYSGAPMPYMQRITWSGVALHAGVVPGYPASHGCIRLPPRFASELWGMTKLGVRVVVMPEEAPAVEVAHAALPAPALTPGPVADVGTNVPVKAELVAMTVSQRPSEAEADALPKLLNPLDRARAAKIHTVADAAAKAKAAKAAVGLSAEKSADANSAIVALRDAERAASAARARLEAAVKSAESANGTEATERTKAAVAAAEAKADETARAVAEAATLEAIRTPEAFAAARAAWDAETASNAAAAAAKAAERGTEPISVFISKKAGRVFIRQAWAPIYEAPVTFKEPQVPLGTHLYLATEPLEDGKAMRWLSVSMGASAAAVDANTRPQRGGRAAAEPPARPPGPRETAASALERIEMAEETRQFIADRLWTGASLIISDQGISNETGKYTDFIVLTR